MYFIQLKNCSNNGLKHHITFGRSVMSAPYLAYIIFPVYNIGKKDRGRCFVVTILFTHEYFWLNEFNFWTQQHEFRLDLIEVQELTRSLLSCTFIQYLSSDLKQIKLIGGKENWCNIKWCIASPVFIPKIDLHLQITS